MKVVVNPTWRCQLSCRYCWLPHVKIDRAAPEHPAEEWAEALTSALPPGSIVDLSGGEPLLFPRLPALLSALGERGIGWAITTNAMDTAAARELAEAHPSGCVVINISDHAGNARAREGIDALRSAFPTSVNRVDHGASGDHEVGGYLLPFQDWEAGRALDGRRRLCDAGRHHWVADPAGRIWDCMVSMQLGHQPTGHLFERWRMAKGVATVCDFGCSTCYRDNPAGWMMTMEEIP